MVDRIHNYAQKEGLVMCEICENWLLKFDEEGTLLRAVFKCGHSLCVDCMKKYIASNIILAYFPIKCPKDGCPGKISSQQASYFIDKKLQLKLTDWLKTKIKRA